MELNNLKARLKTAVRGHKLLKDKRDELMRRFIESVRREQSASPKLSNPSPADFCSYKALERTPWLSEIFAVPRGRSIWHVETENIMSARVPKMHAHIDNPLR